MSDMLVSIFEHQKELHEKYKPIETENGIGFGIIKDQGDFDLNNGFWQALLKDFSYRVVEELMESAYECKSYVSDGAVTEFKENAISELIDALHFLVEYLIVIGVEPIHLVTPVLTKAVPYHAEEDILQYIHDRQVIGRHESYKIYYHNVVFNLGMASHLLKLRPWKTSYKNTDEDMYRRWMARSFYALIALFKFMGVSAEDIYWLYAKKNRANHQRIESNY